MKDLDALQARNLADAKRTSEINEVLEMIISKASKGEYRLVMYKPIESKTIEELKKRGFIVDPTDMLGIQRDGVFNIIHWK